MTTELNLNSRVKRREDPIAVDLAGEVVMMNIETGHYYGLRAIASRVWELLEEPRTVAQICDALQSEYDVDPATCQRDILRFLDDLRSEQLLEIQTA
jgi:hypothetical protein